MIIANETITSRNNPLIKWVAALADKKERARSRAFIAEGVKLTIEALEAGLPITHCFIAESKKDEIFRAVSSFLDCTKYAETRIIYVSDNAFEKMSTEKAPQGVISVINYLDFFINADIIYKEEFFLKSDERALTLCSVRDPSNLGSVIRSAVAFGIEHIILSSDCADIYSPKTIRSAMGSMFKIKVTVVSDMSMLVQALRYNGRRVLAAELSDSAVSLDDIDIKGSDVVIIGNEGHGIPAELSAECDCSVYIPISDKTESLNASVAAAVFMWEQRKHK